MPYANLLEGIWKLNVVYLHVACLSTYVIIRCLRKNTVLNKINMKFHNTAHTSSDADSRSVDWDFSAFYITIAHRYLTLTHALSEVIHSPAPYCISTMTDPSYSSYTSRQPKKLKWSRYRPGVAQRVGKGIALLFHDRGTRRGWVVSSTPRPDFTPGKDPEPNLQEVGWDPEPVWTGGKSRPHRDSIPDHPGRRQSLYRLSYRAHPRQRNVCKYPVFWL